LCFGLRLLCKKGPGRFIFILPSRATFGNSFSFRPARLRGLVFAQDPSLAQPFLDASSLFPHYSAWWYAFVLFKRSHWVLTIFVRRSAILIDLSGVPHLLLSASSGPCSGQKTFFSETRKPSYFGACRVCQQPYFRFSRSIRAKVWLPCGIPCLASRTKVT